MKWIDLTLPTPEENLALDEALLDQSEADLEGEILRFWEPTSPFVVLGYSNRWRTEANATACERFNIPILRRCSGGGTILQGPGCLNYAVVLDIEKRPELGSITETNRFVLEKNAAALATLLGSRPELNGHTDLTVGPLKFSGNSQRRRRHFTLMHGTLLLGFDVSLIEKCLPMPSLAPDYRQNRSHGAFLTNLPLKAEDVKNALKKQWESEINLKNFPRERVQTLVTEAYALESWNRKF